MDFDCILLHDSNFSELASKESRLIVIEYILGNVNISLAMSVAERGMPRVTVVSRLFTTPAGLKAYQG
jgi:hypothetical protein